MRVKRFLVVEGRAASYNFPEFDLNIAVFANGSSVFMVKRHGEDTPLNTKQIAECLSVTEEEVCHYLRCERGLSMIPCNGDRDGGLAQIEWGCLTGFAGSVYRERNEENETTAEKEKVTTMED